MSSDTVTTRETPLTARSLVRRIFDAPSPEEFVKALPAQALYIGVRQQGVTGSADLIAMASIEQCRLLIDFDCWNRDQFCEERFWDWLEVTTEVNDYSLLRKILNSLDLKIVALMLERHVRIEFYEEPTDEPPGPIYSTPDKGYTWLGIMIEDEHRRFLFGRFLAYLFEADMKLFYQLLGVSGVETESSLEEQSYTERNNRLSDEGIPDPEIAFEIHAPLPDDVFRALVSNSDRRQASSVVPRIEPIVYDGSTLRPLEGLIESPRYHEEIESELTLLANAALVHFRVDLSDIEASLHILGQVRGALNIGLERGIELTKLSIEELYERLGLRPLYRLGFTSVVTLREWSRTEGKTLLEKRLLLDAPESSVLAVLEGAQRLFPDLPLFFGNDGLLVEGVDHTLPSGFRAFEHAAQVEDIKAFLLEKLS